MYWSWTLPWNIEVESLLGILTASNVEIVQENGSYLASLVSVGFLIGRVDFIFNLVINEE
jgi:hypothetical protein